MTTPRISAIAAISKNRVLGKDNGLIWKIPEDQKRFREITSGHPVIMGRKTFESIGRPLPNRENIIITRDQNFKAEGCIVVHSLDEALGIASDVGPRHGVAEKNADVPWHVPTPQITPEIFIIGGGQIYTEALPRTDRLYLTVINKEAEGDAFFPAYNEFTKILEDTPGEYNGLSYRFLTLER